MDGIRNHLNIQLILFGSKSEKNPPKCDMARFIIVLITARLIGYKFVNTVPDKTDKNKNKIEIKKLITFLAKNEGSLPLNFNDIN